MIEIGKKIRELRKRKGISQDVLAEYLGVSFQAVSKWETGAGAPDLTLIPAIAAFFDVSIDELFDYNRLETERRVMAICREAAKYRFSDTARSEAILREGLTQYPGNDIILNNLLVVLDPVTQTEEKITICKTLVECTHDDAVKYDALRILADTYHHTGQQDLVAPTLEQIPEIYFTKLEQMAVLLEGEDSLIAARKEMLIGHERLLLMLHVIRERYLWKGETELAAKYGRLADAVQAAFQKENMSDDSYQSVMEWIRAVLRDLT